MIIRLGMSLVILGVAVGGQGRQAQPATTPQSSGTMTGTIDGRMWSARLSVTGRVTEQRQPNGSTTRILAVAGTNQDFNLSVSVNLTDGAGTYTVELRMNDDPSKPAKGTATANLFENASRGAWAASPTSGSGTVTVSTLTPNSASGSFNLVLDPMLNTPARGPRATSGAFTIRF